MIKKYILMLSMLVFVATAYAQIPQQLNYQGIARNASDEHHGNWLDCVKSRKQPIAPVEVGHRSCSTCIVHSIAMKTKRKLYWNATDERFINDDEANGLLNRPHRAPYTIKGLS